MYKRTIHVVILVGYQRNRFAFIMHSPFHFITSVILFFTFNNVASVLVRRYAGELYYELGLRLRIRDVGDSGPAAGNCRVRPTTTINSSSIESRFVSSSLETSMDSVGFSSLESKTTTSTTSALVTTSCSSSLLSSSKKSRSFWNPFSESIPVITVTVY